jgi:hypothetical protein
MREKKKKENFIENKKKIKNQLRRKIKIKFVYLLETKQYQHLKSFNILNLYYDLRIPL